MKIDHVVLNAENVEALLTFYNTIIGLPIEHYEAYKAGEVSFPSLRVNDTSIINLFPPKRWQRDSADKVGEVKNLNHFCLVMSHSEWLALKERVEAANIEIIAGPVQSAGAKGPGTAFHILDPENNRIEIRYYE